MLEKSLKGASVKHQVAVQSHEENSTNIFGLVELRMHNPRCLSPFPPRASANKSLRRNNSATQIITNANPTRAGQSTRRRRTTSQLNCKRRTTPEESKDCQPETQASRGSLVEFCVTKHLPCLLLLAPAEHPQLLQSMRLMALCPGDVPSHTSHRRSASVREVAEPAALSARLRSHGMNRCALVSHLTHVLCSATSCSSTREHVNWPESTSPDR